MHTNYFFIKKLSQAIEKNTIGWTLQECFSQNKDEIIFGFTTEKKEFFIRALLSPEFCCLSFPDEFNRAKKNSTTLFECLLEKKVEKIIQFENERCFALVFEENLILIFKLFGNKSNIILFENNQAVELFHKKMIVDYNINLANLNRQLEFNQKLAEKNLQELNIAYPILGKVTIDYLKEKNWDKKTTEEKWNDLKQIKEYLENPIYYITELNNQFILSLFEIGDIKYTFKDPIQASNQFFYLFTKDFYLHQEKSTILNQLEKNIKKAAQYIEKTQNELNHLIYQTPYQQIGDILMANLTFIQEGIDGIKLHNFYSDQEIEIKLNPKLSPQKNAENYYKKAKNKKTEIEFLEKIIQSKKNQLSANTIHLETIQKIENQKDLKKYIEKENLIKETKKQEQPLPYRSFEYEGFQIWVGKNAKSNDELTLHYSFKEDLWLHAKDVSGSHVLLKYQSGKKFPAHVIEKAAQLAAYYSKRKTDTLCPVLYTPKKYVRKTKGALPGAVIVEKEKVILVEPISF